MHNTMYKLFNYILHNIMYAFNSVYLIYYTKLILYNVHMYITY